MCEFCVHADYYQAYKAELNLRKQIPEQEPRYRATSLDFNS